MSNSVPRRMLPAVAAAAIVLLYLAFGSDYIRNERPNQDEGWYLEAARLVRAGQRPYVDFAYVQPPLLPYVYGLLGGQRSLEAGRTVSLLFGTLAVVLVGVAGWRLGAVGGLVAAALLGLLPFAMSQQTVVKTYALTNALLAGGLALGCHARGRRGWVAAAAGAFALAALTRNSVAPALVALWLWLATSPARRPALWWAVPAGLAPLVVVYLPFALRDPVALHYNLLGHHAEQTAQGGLALLVILVITVARQMVAVAPALSAAVLAGLPLQRGLPRDQDGLAEVELAAWVWVLVVLGHFVSKHPYQEYQALGLPAAAVLGGLCWGRLLAASHERLTVGVLLAVVVGVAPFLAAGPAILQLPGASRPGGVFGSLHRVCAVVRAHSRAEEPLLTFQPDVAIETPRPLWPGLTLASFSFIGDDAKARRLHLMSPALLREALESGKPAVVVLSPGDLDRIVRGRWTPDHHLELTPGLDAAAEATYGPIVAALERNYTLVERVPNVGQFFEEFAVLARREQRK